MGLLHLLLEAPENRISLDNVGTGRYQVELPGVSPALRHVAERDIRLLADSMAAAAETCGMPFMLKRFRITSSFQDDVNQFLKGRSGLVGYVATRDYVQAIAKTLWFRSEDGDLGIAVFIDADQIGRWNLRDAQCLITVLHELGHVVYEGRHVERLGDEEYTADGYTRERWLDRWASRLLDEFSVDRLVDTQVRGLAAKDDGQPWSLQELDEAQGVDWVNHLLDALTTMPEDVSAMKRRFHTKQIDIEKLAAVMTSSVVDRLIVLSHTAARYMETDGWPEIVERLKRTEGSKRLLREHLDAILGQLAHSQLPFEESVDLVAEAVEGIFRYCGLSFKTLPEGVYISVDAPSLWRYNASL